MHNEHSQTFFRIKMLKDFLKQSESTRKILLEELIENATDPVIRMRRFRMLSQLSDYESQVIKKINDLETEDNFNFLENEYGVEILAVTNRNG